MNAKVEVIYLLDIEQIDTKYNSQQQDISMAI